MKKISIVIPTYNELENIELLVNELNDLLNEKSAEAIYEETSAKINSKEYSCLSQHFH